MNVTPIRLAIALYPNIIEYPNAAHIPFSQIPISYPKYSTMYPCQLGLVANWHTRSPIGY